jgi:hypothetical protein
MWTASGSVLARDGAGVTDDLFALLGDDGTDHAQLQALNQADWPHAGRMAFCRSSSRPSDTAWCAKVSTLRKTMRVFAVMVLKTRVGDADEPQSRTVDSD